MEVREVLNRKGPRVWTIHYRQTIRDALRILVEQHIGALVVIDDQERIAGMVSERDIMRECFHQANIFSDIPVASIMSRRVVTARPGDKTGLLMHMMTEHRCRHIPIVDQGRLAGLVSIGDVVKAQLEESARENEYLREYMFGEQAAAAGK